MSHDRYFNSGNVVDVADSDDDDISDSLSPSDGYFSHGTSQVPQQMLVPEGGDDDEEGSGPPVSQTQERQSDSSTSSSGPSSSGSTSKASEAAQESRSQVSSPPQRYRTITPPLSSAPLSTRHTIYTPSVSSTGVGHHRSSSSRIENNPSSASDSDLYEDPPPLYETAVTAGAGRSPNHIHIPQQQHQQEHSPTERTPLTSPTTPTTSSSSIFSPTRNYNTITPTAAMGQPDEFPVPFRDNPSRQPQSMSDRLDPSHGVLYNDEEAGRFGRNFRRQRGKGWLFDKNTSGGRFRRFLFSMFCVLIAIVAFFFLIGDVQIVSASSISPIDFLVSMALSIR